MYRRHASIDFLSVGRNKVCNDAPQPYRAWDWCPLCFFSHHLERSVGNYIPFLVGWCETKSDICQPLYNTEMQLTLWPYGLCRWCAVPLESWPMMKSRSLNTNKNLFFVTAPRTKPIDCGIWMDLVVYHFKSVVNGLYSIVTGRPGDEKQDNLSLPSYPGPIKDVSGLPDCCPIQVAGHCTLVKHKSQYRYLETCLGCHRLPSFITILRVYPISRHPHFCEFTWQCHCSVVRKVAQFADPCIHSHFLSTKFWHQSLISE